MTENKQKNNSDQNWVFIVVQDKSWNQISKFQASKDISLAAQSNQNHCEVPIACGSGACMVCACKVISWMEFVDAEKFWKQLIQPWEDYILSCVAGVYDKYFDEDWYYEIIIQKMI